MSVSSLKFITVEQTGQRIPISTGRSKGLVHYYCLKWLNRYLNVALAGDLLSTLLGMRRRTSDIDLFIPIPVSLAERLNMNRSLYLQGFAKALKCALLKFIARTFDVSKICAKRISMRQLLSLTMRAIQLMVPHDVRRSLFRILCKLVKIAFHADIRCFRDTHPPFHFVAELNVDRSAFDMYLLLVPLIEHNLLKEIPLRKLFFTR